MAEDPETRFVRVNWYDKSDRLVDRTYLVIMGDEDDYIISDAICPLETHPAS
jgi:hypothetical protein